MDDKRITGAAKAMSELGASKGGKARAEKLTSEQRSEIAKKAATARWSIPKAEFEGVLKIGDIEIPCYVLDDGRRVISHRGLQASLGMPVKGGTTETAGFVKRIESKGVTGNELTARLFKPISFQPKRAGRSAFGYEAEVLADMCRFVSEARGAGVLTDRQVLIAARCDILLRGFAKVGIIALVDEATGYQEVRARNALTEILEKFIAKELQAWIPTFSNDYFQQMFRLRGLNYPTDTVQRPQYFGHLTNDIVYKRLAPGVLNELKRVTPCTESGRRKHKYFQRLTSNLGYPKLREHLGAVVAVMKLSKNWTDFMWKLDSICPRFGDTKLLPFPDEVEDDGKGL